MIKIKKKGEVAKSTYKKMALDFGNNGYEGMFKKALRDGINLFCGAGFSVESEDAKGAKLPVGDGLLKELKEYFPSIASFTKLPRACTKLTRTEKGKFYEFLNKRFNVKKYSHLYSNIFQINIVNIYTTNIDDLFFKIYENTPNFKLLQDISVKGNTYPDSKNNKFEIKYYPLHGCIRNKGDYVFGATEIASAFSQKDIQSSWRSLAEDARKNAILFWGWNFEDSGPIEAMYGGNNNLNSNTKRWVLLYEPDDETVEYLESLQFNIIKGSTVDMLEYIGKLEFQENIEENSEVEEEYLSKFTIPQNDKNMATYQMEAFFVDYTPRWSQIYSGRIPKLIHYKRIADSIALGKDVIIYGMRCSGKTTLLMQMAVDTELSERVRHFMVSPSLEQVEMYLKALGSKKSLLFVDEGFRDTDAVIKLLNVKNVQLVLADRDFDYERQYHKISKCKFESVDVTEITPEDAQNIINLIPEKFIQRRSSPKFKKDPTLLTLLAEVIKSAEFNFMEEFIKKDYNAARVFLMICYVHSCGIPCSYDMVYSFLGDDNYTWKQMYDIIERVGELISENTDFFGYYDIEQELQDYYQCRSRFLAEKIIKSIPKGNENLAKMLMDFAKNVPPYKICQYDKFKRNGYDADLMTRAFKNVNIGEEYYNCCAEKDDSAYIYQQAAIYFSRCKELKKAFEWIDKASSMSNYNKFSIDSTYAQIYFDVNVKKDKEQCKKALCILNDCCKNDQRKAIHFTAFSKRVIEYCENYNNESGLFIDEALSYIDEGLTDNGVSLSEKNKRELRNYKNKLETFKSRQLEK